MKMKNFLKSCEKYFLQIQRLLICFEESSSIKRKHRWAAVRVMRDLLTNLHDQCGKFLLKELLCSKGELLFSMMVHFLKLIVTSVRKLKNISMVESTIEEDLKLIYNILGNTDQALVLVAVKAGEVTTEGQGLLYLCQDQAFGVIVREILSTYSVGKNCMNRETLWYSILLSRLWLLSCEREARCKALREMRALLPTAVEVSLPGADSLNVRSMSIESLLKLDMIALIKIAPKSLQSMETSEILDVLDNDKRSPGFDNNDPPMQVNHKTVISILKTTLHHLTSLMPSVKTGIQKCPKLEESQHMQKSSKHLMLDRIILSPSQDLNPSYNSSVIPPPLQIPLTFVNQNMKVIEGSSKPDVSVGGKREDKENITDESTSIKKRFKKHKDLETCETLTSYSLDISGGGKRTEKENKAINRSSVKEGLEEHEDSETCTTLISHNQKVNSQKIDSHNCTRSCHAKFDIIDASGRPARVTKRLREVSLKSEISNETIFRPKKVKMTETEFEICCNTPGSFEKSYVNSNDKSIARGRSCKVRKRKCGTEMNRHEREKKMISQLDHEDKVGHTTKDGQEECQREKNVLREDLSMEARLDYDENIDKREGNVDVYCDEEKSEENEGAKSDKSAPKNDRVADDQIGLSKIHTNKDYRSTSAVIQEDAERDSSVDFVDSSKVTWRVKCPGKLNTNDDFTDFHTEKRLRSHNEVVPDPCNKGLERRNFKHLQSQRNGLNYDENHAEGIQIDDLLIDAKGTNLHVKNSSDSPDNILVDSESEIEDKASKVDNAQNISVLQFHENEYKKGLSAQDIVNSQKVVDTQMKMQKWRRRSSEELFTDTDENFYLVLESDTENLSSHIVKKTSEISSEDMKTQKRKSSKDAATNSSTDHDQHNSVWYLKDEATSKTLEGSSSYVFKPLSSKVISKPLRCEGHSLNINFFNSMRKHKNKVHLCDFERQDKIHSMTCEKDFRESEIKHVEKLSKVEVDNELEIRLAKSSSQDESNTEKDLRDLEIQHVGKSCKVEIDKNLKIRHAKSSPKEESNTEKAISVEKCKSKKKVVRFEGKEFKKQENNESDGSQKTLKIDKEVTYLSSERVGNANEELKVEKFKKTRQEPKKSAINRTRHKSPKLEHNGSLLRNLKGVEIQDNEHVPEGWRRIIKPRVTISAKGPCVRTDVKQVLLPNGKSHHCQKSLKKDLRSMHSHLKEELDLHRMFRLSPSTKAKVMQENEHLVRGIAAERERAECYSESSSKTCMPRRLTFEKNAAKSAKSKPKSGNKFTKGEKQKRKNGMRDLKIEICKKSHANDCNKVAGKDARKLCIKAQQKKNVKINPRVIKLDTCDSSSDFTACKSSGNDPYEFSEKNSMGRDIEPMKLSKVSNRKVTEGLDICTENSKNESNSLDNDFTSDTAVASWELSQVITSGHSSDSPISEVQKLIELNKNSYLKEGNLPSFRNAVPVDECQDGDFADQDRSHKESGQSHSLSQASTAPKLDDKCNTFVSLEGVQLPCNLKVEIVKLHGGLYAFRVPDNLKLKTGDILYGTFEDIIHEASAITVSDSQDVSVDGRNILSGTAMCDNLRSTGLNEGDFVVDLHSNDGEELQCVARSSLHCNNKKNNKYSTSSKGECRTSEDMSNHSNSTHLQRNHQIFNTRTSPYKVPLDVLPLKICSGQVKGKNVHTSSLDALFGSFRKKCLDDLITPQNKKTYQSFHGSSPRNQETQSPKVLDFGKVPVFTDEESGDRVTLIPLPDTVTGENIVLELNCYRILPHNLESSYLIDSLNFLLSHDLVSHATLKDTMLQKQLHCENSNHFMRKCKSKIVSKQSEKSSESIDSGKPSCRKKLLEYFIGERNSTGLEERKLSSSSDTNASDVHISRELEVIQNEDSLNAFTLDGGVELCSGDVHSKIVFPVKPPSNSDHQPDENLFQDKSIKAASTEDDISIDIDFVETGISTFQSQTVEDGSESHCLDVPVQKMQSSLCNCEAMFLPSRPLIVEQTQKQPWSRFISWGLCEETGNGTLISRQSCSKKLMWKYRSCPPRHQQTALFTMKRSQLYIWLTLMLIMACLLVHQVTLRANGNSNNLREASLIFGVQRYRRHSTMPLPVWGQNHMMNEKDPLAGVPMLMLVTSDDLIIIRRSIESVLKETAGSGMHLTVSVQDPTDKVMSLLQGYPLKIHVVGRSGESSPSSDGIQSFLQELLPSFSILDSFKNMVEAFTSTDVCVKDMIDPVINILKTGVNMTEINEYKPNLKEIREKERGAFYSENPYNPVYRKAVINSKRNAKWEDITRAGKSEDSVLQQRRSKLSAETKSLCLKSKFFKEALQFVKTYFPHLQYLMLLETGYAISPDFLSYFRQTIHTLNEDSSVYCISAHNPLASAKTSGNITRVYRFDHFISKASLIPVKVVDEILKDFVIYKETNSEEEKSVLESLEVWLSWWSCRRRRGCIVPDVPRICPLHNLSVEDSTSEAVATDLDKYDHVCSQESHVILFNTSRLLHYKYSQDLFWTISAAEPLGVGIIDCNNQNFFPEKMNATLYIIYIKMESYYDDFTFHHVMKCFGLDLPAAVGYFEGIFRFTFRQRAFLIMGIPYSRFSPLLKNPDALIVADIPELYVKGQTNYLRHKNRNFTFATVVVKQNIV
ncbi:uncharacterized protein [Panulirus ornatus]|uniref:uncharacterized protein n=1 Tax=Panulirus ornatus TaxID=150431 RepID=UPI003A8ACD84